MATRSDNVEDIVWVGALMHKDAVRGIELLEGRRETAFFFVRPAGRTHLEVKVLYLPGKEKG
jgi:hypothetical protein